MGLVGRLAMGRVTPQEPYLGCWCLGWLISGRRRHHHRLLMGASGEPTVQKCELWSFQNHFIILVCKYLLQMSKVGGLSFPSLK